MLDSRRGFLVRDAENAYLDLAPENEAPMDTIMGHSITYRIAAGPNAGRKVFTLQTLPASQEPTSYRVANLDGFSLHAGVAAEADERDKLERLCRYITRPAVSEKRLSLTANGRVTWRPAKFLGSPGKEGATDKTSLNP